MFNDFDVISEYSRNQAIDDGELIDASSMAKELGIKVPVALTRRLWDSWITPTALEQSFGQSTTGRLWDALWMFRVFARDQGGVSQMHYQLIFQKQTKRATLKKHTVTLKAVIGPGDEGEPVITIMLPDED